MKTPSLPRRSSARAALAIIAAGALLAGCAMFSTPPAPVERLNQVDIQRYMGAWFVIAAIPLPVEMGAYDPVESYVRNPDGTIGTVFQFRKGGFDGELQVKPIVSEIVGATGNSEWRVQTLWPLKQQYVISHLEADYSAAIVERDAHDHVWILSRKPVLPPEQIERYRRTIAADGFDVSKLVMFPQDGRRPLP